MPDLVRVKDPDSGAEYTTSAEYAEAAGLTVLNGRPAVDDFGRHLPPKPNTSKGAKPATTEIQERA